MKKLITFAMLFGLVSCATTQEQEAKRDEILKQRVTLEMNCNKLENFKVTGTQGGGAFEHSYTIYMTATCDSRPVRCKENIETKPGSLSHTKNMTCSKS